MLEAGGLHIIGTERHESRRIDNQLRGRSGRQGDPGSTQFFISLEDDLMKRFGGEKLQTLMLKLAGDEDPGIEGWAINSSIERAQRRVEGHHFEIRKHLLDYDDVLSKQREIIYGLRGKILREDFTEEDVIALIDDVVESIILTKLSAQDVTDEDNTTEVLSLLTKQLGIEISEDLIAENQSSEPIAQKIFDAARDHVHEKFKVRKERVGIERMLYLQRIIHLQAIDHFWKDHLTLMDNIRDGINLRGYGQKNPLHEYQKEGYIAFGSMMNAINFAVAQHILLVELPTEEEIKEIEEQEKEALRQREEAARQVHIDTLAAQEKENESTMNRAERRSKKANAKRKVK